MNREDIIRMAEEAGFQYYQTFTDGDVCVGDECGSLVKFAQLVAAHEREQIARLVFDMQAVQGSIGRILACQDIAAAIRART